MKSKSLQKTFGFFFTVTHHVMKVKDAFLPELLARADL